MKDNRKIVFIIGNGFDLNLGRKTSYKDFWESDFCPKDYPAPIVNHLNGKWPEGGEGVKWYDMENELLHYYDGFGQLKMPKDVIAPKEKTFARIFNPDNSIDYYRSSYQAEIDSLSKKNYLEINRLDPCGSKFRYKEDFALPVEERDKIAIQRIKEGLCGYLKSISREQKNDGSFAVEVIFALTQALEQGNTLDIYNFNYTDLPYPYGGNYNNIVHYVHGRCSESNIIIGTKDYEKFNKQYDFLQKALDPNFAPPAIVYDLLNADDVVIFGHSLGVNDSQYFKAFFKQQSSPASTQRKKITIFTWDNSSEIEIKRALQQMTDYNLSSLASLNDFQILKVSQLYHNASLVKDFLSRYISDKRQVAIEIDHIREQQ